MTAPVADWVTLLVDAVEKPGVIAEAYRRFWNYSIGNQLLALFQCAERGIEPGPINTFLGWRDCRRFVKKGEKALTLCMPVVRKMKRKTEEKQEKADVPDNKCIPVKIVRFLYRPHWFVLSQTDGEPYQPADLPNWSEERALEALNIQRIPFDLLNGNVQGYASGRTVAVSPIAFGPHRTLLHELAHVVLGHTAEIEKLIDEETTPRNIKEVEAESVAMLCCASLSFPGAEEGIEHSRGYIQNWLRSDSIPDRSAQRIFKAADLILKAGYPITPNPGDQT